MSLLSGCGVWSVREDGFYGDGEESGDAKGKWERRVILAGFNGVDGLTGDLKALGEICLRPVALRTEDAEAVSHWLRGGDVGIARPGRDQR